MRPTTTVLVLIFLVPLAALGLEAVHIELEPAEYEACIGGNLTLGFVIGNPTRDQQLYTIEVVDPDAFLIPLVDKRVSVGRGIMMDDRLQLFLSLTTQTGEHPIGVRAYLSSNPSMSATAEGIVWALSCGALPEEESATTSRVIVLILAFLAVTGALVATLRHAGPEPPAPPMVYPQTTVYPGYEYPGVSYYSYRYPQERY